MATATLADLSVTAPAIGRVAESKTLAQPDTWKQQTVGEFFARCNWENIEVPVLPVTAGADSAVAFDYNRSVGQFFGAIPWAGGAAVVSAGPAQGEILAAATSPGLDLTGPDQVSIEELPDLEEIADESHLDSGDVTLDDFLGSFSL